MKRRNTYTADIHTLCTPTQRAAWTTAAEADARPLSGWIRLQLDIAAKQQTTRHATARAPTRQ